MKDIDHMDCPANESSGQQEKNDKENNFINLSRDVLSNTSAQGIGRVVSEVSTLRKVLWALIFCGALCYSFWQAYKLIDYFLEYDISVKTQLVYR